jgi:regulator of sigma E protease
LVFGALIFIHELGHYLTARLFDVHILEFAIGMGPRLLSYKSKKTGIVYSIRMILFGGFVSMVGEDDEGFLDADGNPISQGGAGAFNLSTQGEAKDGEIVEGDFEQVKAPAAPVLRRDPRALNAKPVWQRMIITAAGAAMNIILGMVLALALVLSMDAIGGTMVGRFEENAISQTQGLQMGDVITHINGKRVTTHMDLAYAIAHDGYEPVEITLRRGCDVKRDKDGMIVSYSGGKEIVLKDVTFGTQEEEGILMGTQDFRPYQVKKTFANVMNQTFCYTRLAVRQVLDGLLDLITGRFGLQQMSGPVGVTQQIGQAVSLGLTNVIFFVQVITVNLGVMNLLPLPALDGGRLLFQFIELIFRKPIPREWEGRIHLAGLALLLLLMVIITGQDLIRIFVK